MKSHHQLVSMPFDCANAQVQCVGDPLVRLTGDHQFQDAPLLRGQDRQQTIIPRDLCGGTSGDGDVGSRVILDECHNCARGCVHVVPGGGRGDHLSDEWEEKSEGCLFCGSEFHRSVG